MSLRHNRQISHHPKNSFVGQLVCPHCQTAFAVTWRRYWAAPWGNYRCPQCRQISHATANTWWVSLIVFVAIALVGIVGALFGAYVFHNAWMGAFLIFAGYFGGFPLESESLCLPSVFYRDDVSFTSTELSPLDSNLHSSFVVQGEKAELDFTIDQTGRLKTFKLPRWGNPDGAEFREIDFG